MGDNFLGPYFIWLYFDSNEYIVLEWKKFPQFTLFFRKKFLKYILSIGNHPWINGKTREKKIANRFPAQKYISYQSSFHHFFDSGKPLLFKKTKIMQNN